jgi:hypothetical protein
LLRSPAPLGPLERVRALSIFEGLRRVLAAAARRALHAARAVLGVLRGRLRLGIRGVRDPRPPRG